MLNLCVLHKVSEVWQSDKEAKMIIPLLLCASVQQLIRVLFAGDNLLEETMGADNRLNSQQCLMLSEV